jgi:RHS repeat-associated protein
MAKLNPFMFSTKFYDWETGLYYYGYRYYNPSTGRWLSRDPIGERGGKNLYAFVLNRPTYYIDRFGLDNSICEHLEAEIENAIKNLFSGPMGTLNPTVEADLHMLMNAYYAYNCGDNDGGDGHNRPPTTLCPSPAHPAPKPSPKKSPKPAPTKPSPEPAPVFPIVPVDPVPILIPTVPIMPIDPILVDPILVPLLP